MVTTYIKSLLKRKLYYILFDFYILAKVTDFYSFIFFLLSWPMIHFTGEEKDSSSCSQAFRFKCKMYHMNAVLVVIFLTLFSSLLCSIGFFLTITSSSNHKRFYIIFLRNIMLWKILFYDICGADLEKSEDTLYFLSCILTKPKVPDWL